MLSLATGPLERGNSTLIMAVARNVNRGCGTTPRDMRFICTLSNIQDSIWIDTWPHRRLPSGHASCRRCWGKWRSRSQRSVGGIGSADAKHLSLCFRHVSVDHHYSQSGSRSVSDGSGASHEFQSEYSGNLRLSSFSLSAAKRGRPSLPQSSSVSPSINGAR